MNTSTKAIDSKFDRKDPYGALAMPVYHTAAYEFETAADMADAFTGKVAAPEYSRVMNPTVMCLEERVKAITGAAHVFAFNCGMAAITNVLLALAGNGKTIVTSPHLFGNTYALITGTLARFGVKHKLVDFTRPEAVREAVAEKGVCCIFFEIITNPQQEVADIRALAQIAGERGIPLVADTTMIPFTEFSAKDLGIDIEVVSSTKYVSGGATSLGGLVMDYGRYRQVNQRIRYELLFNVGGYMTPHAAYMQTVGLETLRARYAMQSAGALALARKLQALPQIQQVTYLGLTDNPYYDLARRQFGETSGAMITIDLRSEQDCYDFLNRLQVVRRATNLFDNRSLAIHPYSTIFGNFSTEQRRQMDVRPTTIRLSVGLEEVDDLFEDIRQAIS